MPDISMCAATCPRSTTCKRHEDSGTVPGYFQSWMAFDPENCENYWPVENIWENCAPDDLRLKSQLRQAYQELANDPEYQAEVKLWDVCVGDGLEEVL